MISPSSFIRIATAVVLPPGAAHISNILSPGWGSGKKNNLKMVENYLHSSNLQM
jgi:hypothetical protein